MKKIRSLVERYPYTDKVRTRAVNQLNHLFSYGESLHQHQAALHPVF